MRGMTRPLANVIFLTACTALVVAAAGCVGPHAVVDPQLDSRVVKIDLRSHRQGLLGRTVKRGFAHPTTISAQRLSNILGALEVEERTGPETTVRRIAIHPDIRDELAMALSAAYAEAGPDQEILVRVVRKQMQKGIFHRKYLTSFVTYMRDDLMYVFLARVDWLIPRRDEDEEPAHPDPKRGGSPYKIVAGPHMFFAGTQGVEIEWRSPVFEQAYRLPDAVAAGETRTRTVLEESPLPRLPQDDDGLEERLDGLTPDQLRALADLEEGRREGRITENEYLRARRDLLRR